MKNKFSQKIDYVKIFPTLIQTIHLILELLYIEAIKKFLFFFETALSI